MYKIRSMNKVTSTATTEIDKAYYNVTEHIHNILRNANIPENIVMKYSANYCHGGEWILDDGYNLSQRDIQLISNEELIKIVKNLENLE